MSLAPERCEWNPFLSTLARHPRRAGDCPREARVSVGDAEPLHLCLTCASLTVFAGEPQRRIEAGPRIEKVPRSDGFSITDDELIRRRKSGMTLAHIAMLLDCEVSVVREHERRALSGLNLVERRKVRHEMRAAGKAAQRVSPMRHPDVLVSASEA